MTRVECGAHRPERTLDDEGLVRSICARVCHEVQDECLSMYHSLVWFALGRSVSA